jgi:ankyrin repeat protein
MSLRWCARAGLVALVVAAAPVRASGPPLIDAIRHGDVAAAERLIATADVNAREADGTTALHWAARANAIELVGRLLRAGADPGAVNRYGMTPLQLAVVTGNPRLVGALIEAGADVNAALPEGETVLMTAARTGDQATLELLLDNGAAIGARESWYGETALMWAAAEDHADAVRLLLERGAEVDAVSTVLEIGNRRQGQNILPLGGWTSLMYAARQNAVEGGRALIEGGADLDAVDPDGATALAIAIINGNYDVAAVLLEAGADPNIVDTAAAMGPLYAAADMHRLAVGHGRPNPRPHAELDAVDIVRLLLEHGADPNAALDGPIMQRHHTGGDSALGKGATPLMRASKSGDVAVMRLLLDAGADPHATTATGTTPLMLAAGLGWRDGSPAAPSFDQGTEEEAVAAIDLLLGAGLDINATNEAGDTPLHAAVGGRGSELIVQALVERGANLNVANGRGRTPLDAALGSRQDRSAIARVLEAAGGKPGEPVDGDAGGPPRRGRGAP